MKFETNVDDFHKEQEAIRRIMEKNKIKNDIDLLLYGIFQTNGDLLWPSHDTHMHTNLIDWLKCPQTCIEEIIEFFERIK